MARRWDREQVLRFVREEAYRPLRLEELMKALGVPPAQREAFQVLLREMEEAGELVRTRSGRYAAPERLDLVVGKVQAHRRGFAFVVPETRGQEDLHITQEMLHGAMHGDRVLARRLPGQREGEVVRILSRAQSRIVGVLEIPAPEVAFVRPEDPRLVQDVVVPQHELDGGRDGDLVVVEITRYPDGRRSPMGRVVERLGRPEEPGVDVEALIRQHQLPTEFPPEVLAEAARVPDRVRPQDRRGRQDLRDLLTFTIDSEDAKDLDDAVSIEPIQGGEGGYRLGVHIADVAYYVREGSALDREALARGTSIYLVDRVIPMLPPRLSNEICSLQPRQDRLCLSVFLDFDARGRVRARHVAPSVIRTSGRLTYEKVQAALDGDPGAVEEYRPFLAALQSLQKLKDLLFARRQARGSIDFDLGDEKIRLDERGRPVAILARERTDADRIIEECMLAANEAVASLCYEAEVPCLYRVHEEPTAEKMEILREFLAHFGYALPPVTRTIHPAHLQRILRKAEGRPEEKVIHTMVLRSMQRARYDAQCLGHFGLATQRYTHFTSPIRRYPDLVVHRILREILRHGGTLPQKRSQHYRRILPEVAAHASERERVAEEAERDSVELKKVQFMEDKIGAEMDGVISGVTNFGFFVHLDVGVEGVVRLSSLTDDYYHFDERLFTLMGERTGRVFRLGDPVRVRVVRVDRRERQVELHWVRGGTLPTKRKGARRRKASKARTRRRLAR